MPATEVSTAHLSREIGEVRKIGEAVLESVRLLVTANSSLVDRVGKLETRTHDIEARELTRVQVAGIGRRVARFPALAIAAIAFVLGAGGLALVVALVHRFGRSS